VVEAVLLRPLPYVESDDVVMLRHRDLRTGITKYFVAMGDVIDLRARDRGLEVLAPYTGVMSYSVSRRTRELGTRLALGADRARILWLVIRQAVVITGVGIALGPAAGLAAARWLASMLYGVPPWDPAAIVAAVVVLALSALTAAYVPAYRASRIDPARALAPE